MITLVAKRSEELKHLKEMQSEQYLKNTCIALLALLGGQCCFGLYRVHFGFDFRKVSYVFDTFRYQYRPYFGTFFVLLQA